MRDKARTEPVPHAAKHKCPQQVHLCTRPSAALPAQPRMLLHPDDRRFEQVSKEQRQQQNEESTTRQLEDRRRAHRERHGGDYIPGTNVE